MIATLKLTCYEHTVDTFTLPYPHLNKAFIQNLLRSQYKLQSGYEISYVDADGDQIAVEFDDDYEVAKLTHEDSKLTLFVKVNDQNWFYEKEDPDQKFDLEIKAKIDSLEVQTKNPQPQPQNIIEKHKISEIEEEEVRPFLLEPLIVHSIIEQEVLDSINEPKPQEEIISKPEEMEETELLVSKTIPTQYKRTETQTSELQSLDEISEIKAPKKKPTLDFIEDRVPFVQEQSQNEKPEILEAKGKSKPKEKKVKDKNQKSIKKPKVFTEKEIKKLVKKQVFKLLPQIAQKIKAVNDVNESSEPEISEKIAKQTKEESSDVLTCAECAQTLTVPFYVNSIEGIMLCTKCEEKDESTYALVKIRNEAMLKSLEWAQPLCYTAKQGRKDEMPEHKFLNEVQQAFIVEIKGEFAPRIKAAKEAKRQQKQGKEKAKLAKSKKDQKDKKE